MIEKLKQEIKEMFEYRTSQEFKNERSEDELLIINNIKKQGLETFENKIVQKFRNDIEDGNDLFWDLLETYEEEMKND